MIQRQRTPARDVGNDTHVRDYDANAYKNSSSGIFGMQMGEIKKTEPEPLFNQNLVTVELARGGELTSVAYPGVFVDPLSKNIHGLYEGPIKGQMVIVGFENGNAGSPFVVNRYPYQGIGDTANETAYMQPLTTAGFDAEDVILGHKSGSFIAFYTGVMSGELPGSVTFYSPSDINIQSDTNFLFEATTEAELKSPTIKLTADTQIELNGNSNYAVKYTELKTAFDQLKQDFDNFVSLTYGIHTHPYVDTPVGPSVTSPTTSQGSPSSADMSSSKNSKVLM
jgi:hypothetical protein